MTADLDGHPRIPRRIPTAPDVAVDRERLTERERLGRGATADVVARDVAGADATVAVKQPRLEGTLRADAVDEFVAEAEQWSKLDDGDHVVGVVDWGTEPLPWIALERMDGGSLAERIGRLSTAEALWIAVCAADGVWSAHRRGVAHLDLKPENVLFRTTDHGVWDVPKVSDWGLARLLLEASTTVEGLSPRYASPEQFEPETYGPPDDASDVYQLGTIVHELLTGEPAFDGAATTVMERHLSAEPTPPTAVDPTLPAAADDVVLGALAKEKADRYESMLDFRRDLEALFARVADGDAPRTGREEFGPARSGGATGEAGRIDPLESGPGTGGTDPLDGGSSIAAGSDGRRILDRVREQSRADRERRVPWQARDDAPGIDPDDDGGAAESTPDDGVDLSADDATTEPADDDGDTVADALAGVGLAGGLLVSATALVAGAPVGLVVGVPIAVVAAWRLSEGG